MQSEPSRLILDILQSALLPALSIWSFTRVRILRAKSQIYLFRSRFTYNISSSKKTIFFRGIFVIIKLSLTYMLEVRVKCQNKKSKTESKMQSSNFLDGKLHENALKLVDYLNFERK